MKCLNQLTCTALATMLSLSGCGDTKTEAVESQTRTAASVSTAATSIPVSVTGLTKVSEARIGRTVYEYVFQVTFLNSGAQLSDIKAQITSAGTGTTIVDGTVTVGNLASGASTTPTDTITLRHDRTFTFDPAALKWQINGTPVPIPPTDIPGVDANRNGVRDDVEAYIEGKYGTDPIAKAAAMQYGRVLQKKLSAGPEQVDAILAETARSMFCMFDSLGADGSEVMLYNIRNVQLDNEPRLAAYLAFDKSAGGSVVSMPSATRTPRSTCD